MDSSKIELSRVRVRRNLMSSAIPVIIAAIAFINITKHSNIRNVEIITILGCGMTFGAFIVNLVLFFKMNKQRNLTETGY